MAGKAKKDPTLDPGIPSAAYLRMAPQWRRISTLLAGTDAMRLAGQDYLPQHDAESPAAYNERLTRCTLYNMTELTLDSLVGKVFVEPLVYDADVPPQIAALYENVDMCGNDASVFAREVFRMALAKTVAHVLVDMPVVHKREDASLEDDLKARPFWSLVDPENVIFMYAETENGEEVLKQVRILENVETMDGFAIKNTPQIRILFPGRWETWQPGESKNSKD